MSLDYHEMMKSPEDLAQEEELRKREQVNEAILRADREQWLSMPSSKRYLGELTKLAEQANINLLDRAHNSQTVDEEFRRLAVEVQTLRKTLNLLYNGKYNYTDPRAK